MAGSRRARGNEDKGGGPPPPAGPPPRSGHRAGARPLPLPLRPCRRAARGPAAVRGVSPSLPSVSPSRSKFSPIPHLRSTQASNPSSWRRRRPGHPTSGREAGDGRAGSALSFEASAGARLGARAGGQHALLVLALRTAIQVVYRCAASFHFFTSYSVARDTFLAEDVHVRRLLCILKSKMH